MRYVWVNSGEWYFITVGTGPGFIHWRLSECSSAVSRMEPWTSTSSTGILPFPKLVNALATLQTSFNRKLWERFQLDQRESGVQPQGNKAMSCKWIGGFSQKLEVTSESLKLTAKIQNDTARNTRKHHSRAQELAHSQRVPWKASLWMLGWGGITSPYPHFFPKISCINLPMALTAAPRTGASPCSSRATAVESQLGEINSKASSSSGPPWA